jgi:hypothetical protein
VLYVRFRPIADDPPMQHTRAMRLQRSILFAILGTWFASAAAAQQASAPAAAAILHGLSASDAGALIKDLQDLQRQLKNGEKVFFELLSGAPASFPETEISPREAFLQMPFDKAIMIERARTDNRYRQPFKVIIAPHGRGLAIWKVEVMRDFGGRIERVTMVHGPPLPF